MYFIGQATYFSNAQMCNLNMYEGKIVLPAQELKAVCFHTVSMGGFYVAWGITLKLPVMKGY